MLKAVRSVDEKNYLMLHNWKDTHPKCIDSDSTHSKVIDGDKENVNKVIIDK